MYHYIRAEISKAGFNPEAVETLAKSIASAKDLGEAAHLYSQFEVESDPLPWPQDHDFGALALQAESVNAAPDIARFMLSCALIRARWCATCATSGGEGLARMRHVHELEIALKWCAMPG